MRYVGAFPLLLAFVAGWMGTPSRAQACGCFAPPSVGEPVVQAGERIAFRMNGGRVEAHIQIQYQGEADAFAWLLPLPSAPSFHLGSEVLFTVLESTTAPRFFVRDNRRCGGGGLCSDGGEGRFESNPRVDVETLPSELSSAGPFDYGVVRSETKDDLLEWLRENRFFVPSELEGVLDPYLRAGAYFLAVKLRAGEPTGAIQPVIVEYASDRPMIPIILTSASAVPDMPILVWVFGDSRAVPLNYADVQINEGYIEWFGAAENYPEVVARAVDEADGGHGFVTEFVGPISELGRLSWPSSASGELKPTSLENLRLGLTQLRWSEALIDSALAGFDASSFEPEVATAAVVERLFEPLARAQALFEAETVTRLHTALDPEEMTADPVFDFNPDLPMVRRDRSVRLLNCGDPEIVLPDGRRLEVETSFEDAARGQPFAVTISRLGLEGAPEVLVDNRDQLGPGRGCQGLARDMGASLPLVLLLLGTALGRRYARVLRLDGQRRRARSPSEG